MIRVSLVAASIALAASVAGTARAETPRWSPGGQTALEATLLAQWHKDHPRRVFDGAAPHAQAAADREDPAATLGTYVERVWSQIRAYRRPGGAEVLVRTRF